MLEEIGENYWGKCKSRLRYIRQERPPGHTSRLGKGKVTPDNNATLIRNKWGFISLKIPNKSNCKLGSRKSGVIRGDSTNESNKSEREMHHRRAAQVSHDHPVVDRQQKAEVVFIKSD